MSTIKGETIATSLDVFHLPGGGLLFSEKDKKEVAAERKELQEKRATIDPDFKVEHVDYKNAEFLTDEEKTDFKNIIDTLGPKNLVMIRVYNRDDIQYDGLCDTVLHFFIFIRFCFLNYFLGGSL